LATVNDFINRALRSVTILRTGGTASAAQATNALEALNEMLGHWYADGIPINDGDLLLTDTFPVDGTEKYAIRENLAVMLAKEHNRPINPQRQVDALNLHRDLLNKYAPDYSFEHDTALANVGGRSYNINNDT